VCIAAPNTTSERLLWAHHYGHRWNPAFPNLRNLDEGRVRKMDGSERDAKDLLASWQMMDANVGILCHYIHKRDLEPNGEIGPASEAVMKFNRCPLPDYAPPPDASFHYDDPDLQAAVESQQAAAAAAPMASGINGPYWRECDPQNPGIHSLVIGIDIRSAPSNFLANQDKILAARVACAAEIGVSVRFVINPQSLDGLNQYQVYRNIPGGVIGMNYFPQTNSCGRIPNGSMDSTYNPSDWRLHAGLGTHESEGHGFGFNHTPGGIMNASIILTWPLTWIGDPAWSQVKRYYPAKPLGQPKPPPGPGPGPGPIIPIGTLKIIATLPPGEYPITREIPTFPPGQPPISF
jgi:hypothetical protein